MITIAIKDHPGVDTAALARAMQVQVDQLAAAWQITGGINVIRYPRRKPKGAWRVQFYDELPAGMGGVHLGAKQPYAKVLAGDQATVAASHEILEMLVDPAGQRFLKVNAREYLVEVCDPVEGDTITIGGVELSNWILPSYYHAGDPSDYAGLMRAPVPSLRPLGYISWIELGAWWQAFCDAQGNITKRRLGLARARTRREKDRLAAR